MLKAHSLLKQPFQLDVGHFHSMHMTVFKTVLGDITSHPNIVFILTNIKCRGGEMGGSDR